MVSPSLGTRETFQQRLELTASPPCTPAELPRGLLSEESGVIREAEPAGCAAVRAQSCPILGGPKELADRSPPGSSVHGIL